MAIQWPLLIFSVLLGISSGAMIFAGIGEVKGKFKNVRFLLGIIAFAAVALGGIASTFHLGHPERALHILGNVGSAFSRELFMVGAMGIVSLAYAVVAKKNFDSAAKVLGIIGAVIGVVLPLVAGASYLMPARPVWDTFLLPLMYLGTGIGMGSVLAAALVVGKAAEADAEEAKFAVKLALAGIVVMAAVMVLYVAWFALAPHQDETRSLMRLVAGDLAPAFWIGVVALGIVAPVALGMFASKKPGGEGNAATLLWAAFACSVVGSVALRAIMYLAATSVERFIY